MERGLGRDVEAVGLETGEFVGGVWAVEAAAGAARLEVSGASFRFSSRTVSSGSHCRKNVVCSCFTRTYIDCGTHAEGSLLHVCSRKSSIKLDKIKKAQTMVRPLPAPRFARY